jgi:hypothetical protein
MNWDAIGAITGVIAFLLTLFIEWPRVRTRWLEVVPRFNSTVSLTQRLITISGYVIIIGTSLILSTVVWPYEYLALSGRLIFTFGCLSLGFSIIGEHRQNTRRPSDPPSSFYDSVIMNLTRFIGIYMLLFGVVAGTLAVWDLIRWVQS